MSAAYTRVFMVNSFYLNGFRILLFPQPTQLTLQIGGSLFCRHTNNTQVYNVSPVCARMISSLGTCQNSEKYKCNIEQRVKVSKETVVLRWWG